MTMARIRATSNSLPPGVSALKIITNSRCCRGLGPAAWLPSLKRWDLCSG